MFGFDGNTEGLKKILERIAANPGEGYGALTHKEVRAYARCLIALVPFLQVGLKLEPELKILLALLSVSGLPHYDRSFIATKILELLPKGDQPKSEFIPDDF